MSGATFNLLPTHKLFGIRYNTFSAANIHFNSDFSKERVFFWSHCDNSKNYAKKQKKTKKLHKNIQLNELQLLTNFIRLIGLDFKQVQKSSHHEHATDVIANVLDDDSPSPVGGGFA